MLDPKNAKDKDKKNATVNFCHSSNLSLAFFSENNSSDGNLSKADNTIDKIFSNDQNKEVLILVSKKTK